MLRSWFARITAPSRDGLRLGRWSVGADQRQTARRAQLAAADNCGVSGNSATSRFAKPDVFDSSMDAALAAVAAVESAPLNMKRKT